MSQDEANRENTAEYFPKFDENAHRKLSLLSKQIPEILKSTCVGESKHGLSLASLHGGFDRGVWCLYTAGICSEWRRSISLVLNKFQS